jgi:prepilin-type N-terminal cleavage/methylation domain-containing protein
MRDGRVALGKGNPAFLCRRDGLRAQMRQNDKGLTIIELMVVIGILAIVAGVVTPNFINWRGRVALRGAANNLKGDLELAKARAIRENDFVAIHFYAHDHYKIFVDNGEGMGGIPDNWIREGDEALLRDREMPSGVLIDLGPTSFGGLGDKTRFNGRGHCTPGSAYLQNDKGDIMRVKVSRLGLITIERQ